MVAIVSGIGAGLNLGSREVLGQQGVIGKAAEGRNGQGVYVNVATGLLVVQNQDDFLAARGHDAAAVRTYISTDDLEGGELVFPTHDVSVTPVTGTLVAFPSNHLFPHMVNLVTKGKRIAIARHYYVKDTPAV
jgi:predicted 2-oxoglutarate/Fe(II)-dependent dioxygenase YbiX